MNREANEVDMDDGGDDDNNGDDNDNDDADDKGDGADKKEDDTDENMEDQLHISSLLTKRKRVSETTTFGSTSSKHQKKLFTEEDISATIHQLEIILEEPDSSPATQTDIVISEVPAATQQLVIPLTASTTLSTEATTVTTIPSFLPTATSSLEITMPETSASALLLSSDSTSGSLHPEETNEQRIARKMKARQDREREMILKIQAEAELREEAERKQKLKELSDSDRAYLLKLSGEEAEQRDREMRLKKEQEECDAVFAKVLQDVEDSQIVADAAKKKKGTKSSVDKLWNEIDRKKYAARMTGRSNSAPITKVYLKKPKNKSQAQLLIHRGTETQAIALDQVCKLHREEWNEIRLAVSHSSSAAKSEVLNEINRLFQKMVELQLLRPEDTVIHGEEIVQPPSPRYRSGTSSIHRIPNTSKLNLSIPDDVPRVEGVETSEGVIGLVYRDLNGALRFQRETELEKIDHEQLVHLIRSASMLDKSSHMRKAILEEALARQFRYLPSTEKYELADELGVVKEEDIWKEL